MNEASCEVRFWAQAVGQALAPCRFSVAILILGAFVFLRVGQTEEALMVLCQRGNPLAVGVFLCSVAVWAHASWYLPRVLGRFQYPDVGELPRRQLALRKDIIQWAPRALGTAAIAVVAGGLLRCPRQAPGVVPLLVGVVLVGASFAVYVIARRPILRGLRTALAGRVHNGFVVSLWEDIADYQPSKQYFHELPLATRIFLWIHLAIFIGQVFLYMFWPLPVARYLGAQTILIFALGTWITAGSLLVYLSSWYRLPVFMLLAGWAIVISPWTDNHQAMPHRGPAAGLPGHLGVVSDFQAWRKVAPPGPFVVVAAEGGGVRAAYWTAALLSALQDADPSFASHVYGLSTVSGGSVGAAVFEALLDGQRSAHAQTLPGRNDCRTTGSLQEAAGCIFTPDALAPTLSRMLYPEVLQRIVPRLPFLGPITDPLTDRGTALANAWLDAVRTEMPGSNLLEIPLESAAWDGLPRLFLNSTWVEAGKRVVFSRTSVNPGACVDTLDGASLVDVPAIGAVLTSARFPYISPAMTVPGSTGPDWGHLVDGGYFENSGAETALELLSAIADADATAPDGGGGGIDSARVIVIRYVRKSVPDLREDFATDPGPSVPRAARWATEVTAPLLAEFEAGIARESLALAQLKAKLGPKRIAEFILTDVRTPLPLGWMLSSNARTDINACVDDAVSGKESVSCHAPGAAVRPGEKVLDWWRRPAEGTEQTSTERPGSSPR